MDTELESAAEVIDALGGLTPLAAMTGVSYRAAHNWKAARRFPPRTYAVMVEALRVKGHTAPASLWRMAEARAS